jgi:glycosyltransferase involved in cell wall biosynthesis
MKISIVIPCFNAAENLPQVISALNSQSIKPNEIIIADDGSTDNTKNIINYFAKLKKNIKYCWQKNAGPAKARNFGAKKANGEIIVFIDSDCIPEKNWLKEMISPFKDKAVGGVQGTYKTKQTGLIARFVQVEIEERYEKMKKAQKEGTLDWIGSYSAAYRTEAYKKLNGFDETFPIASGEDPELSYRLKKSGYNIVFNPNAIVYHTHPDDLLKYLKTKFFRAYYRPKMYSKHKEKIVKDSYTPQSLKLQIIIIYALVPCLIGSIFINWILLIVAGLILLHASFGAKLFIFAFKKNPIIALASIPILLLRNAFFAAGLIFGMIKS